jgi:hypothetical protein
MIVLYLNRTSPTDYPMRIVIVPAPFLTGNESASEGSLPLRVTPPTPLSSLDSLPHPVFRIFCLGDYPTRIVVLSERSESKDLTALFSTACALFHFPYPLSPLFATLTKTAGGCTNNSQNGTFRLLSEWNRASDEDASPDLVGRAIAHPCPPAYLSFMPRPASLFCCFQLSTFNFIHKGNSHELAT